MHFPVRAITLDLDDTLWPFAPIGARVEQVLHDWLLQHCPRTAAARSRSRRCARCASASTPSTRTCPRLQPAAPADPGARDARQPATIAAHAEAAFETFYAERNRVEFYPDASPRWSAWPRACRWRRSPTATPTWRASASRHAFRLPARRARTRRAQAGRQHLPCRLRAPGVEPRRGAARRRRHRHGRRRRRIAPACAVAGSTARRTPGRTTRSAPISNSPPWPRWPTGSMRDRQSTAQPDTPPHEPAPRLAACLT